MSRLTIVTPTLNQGEFIERTIRSVVSQIGDDDTYVVVDGGSSDQTHEVLERWADRISAVYVRETTQAEALAYGFAQHQAEFACYVNSDDLLLPGAVDKAIRTMRSHDIVGCYSHRIFINAVDTAERAWILPPHCSYLMRRWDYIPQETCFWRYDVMASEGGIDTGLDFAMDYDLFVRLMKRGKLKRVDDFWAAFRVHDESKTQILNATVGQREVRQIKELRGIRTNLIDRLLGPLLREYVYWHSRRFVARSAGVQAMINQAIDK